MNRKMKHGHCLDDKSSPEYSSWRHMRYRVLNPKSHVYHHYGGRGITICERWESFQNFLADMGPRPNGCNIERIDNEGNYEPGNCKWGTTKEQSRNRRNTFKVTYQGVTLCLEDWSKKVGIHRYTLWSRIQYGWPLEEVFTRPVQKRTFTNQRK